MSSPDPQNPDDFPTRPVDEHATFAPSSQRESATRGTWGTDKKFGRYRVERFLNRGGFGEVYQAFDEDLQRSVAIKVTFGAMLDAQSREEFLTEARIVASLEHPHIVPVHDVGRTEEGDYFVVSKLIDGTDLAVRFKSGRPDRILAARIVEAIANALHVAHAKGIVHRDVKPANILLDRNSHPFLTDFGIALRETDARVSGQQVGTPAYMSPEQARGEGHRIDNRSDIYSLGVVLYELLTGRRPFRSENQVDLIQLIATEEVRTPRLFEESIPVELERICLKALARRAADRFQVAKDFADEIRWWLDRQSASASASASASGRGLSGELAEAAWTDRSDEGGNSSSRAQSDSVPTPKTPNSSRSSKVASVSDSQRTGPTKVIPKGLRSFDANDADFFLELLPGPFDRTGLPESLRFWKTRIERGGTHLPFKVGLIYGPSGCGKSSLMKAGLLPRLPENILSVYVEATSEDTESRLLQGIRRAIPDVEGSQLTEVLANIRRKRLVPTGGKLLLIIDQFEQWLHAEEDFARSLLANALRQCDGQHVQAIVMVRDDFWLSVSRFLREIEVPIVEGENSAMVDLFDLDHASKVLGLFGRAFERLPTSSSQWTTDQQQFIKLAVQGLAEDRKVVSVRLAIFSDMMRAREWSVRSLKEVGGIEGVGVTFLEETFTSKHAPPENRHHEAGARELLAALLPERNTDIKGARQSVNALRHAARYDDKPREFSDLLSLLDQRLRLITPVEVEPANKPDVPSAKPEGASHYQLTHDYLVPSLRQWIVKNQVATKTGRAELKLAERARSWKANPEQRQLPSFVEWVRIRWRTDKGRWTEPQREMMRIAGRVHGLRVILLGFCLGAIGLGGMGLREYWTFQKKILIAEQDLSRREVEVKRLVDAVSRAEIRQVSAIIDELRPFQETAVVRLRQIFDGEASDSPGKLNTALALLTLTESADQEASTYLIQRLTHLPLPQQVVAIAPNLQLLKEIANPEYWQTLLDEGLSLDERFRAGIALTFLDAESPLWEQPIVQTFMVEQLVNSSPDHAIAWIPCLRPVASKLLDALANVTKDSSRTKSVKLNAVSAINTYAKDDHARLVDILLETDSATAKAILPLLAKASEAATSLLEESLDEPLLPVWVDSTPESTWPDLTASQIEAVEAAHGQVAERWAYCQDMPLDQFLTLIEEMRAAGYRPTRVRPTRNPSPAKTGPEDDETPQTQMSSITIAAIWSRDILSWKLQVDLPREAFPDGNVPTVQEGMVYQDAGIWPSGETTDEPRFFALWTTQENPDEQRILVLASSELALKKFHRSNYKENRLRVLHCQVDANGERHYTAIWSPGKVPYEFYTQIGDHALLHQNQVDVSLALPTLRPDYTKRLEQVLEHFDQQDPSSFDAEAWETLVLAHYYSGDYQTALSLMDGLNADGVATSKIEIYRVICLAKLRRLTDAMSAEAALLENPDLKLYHDFVSVLAAAANEEWNEAFERLQNYEKSTSRDGNSDYNVACAAAVCGEWYAVDHEDASQFKELALRLLLRSKDRGYDAGATLFNDFDLRSLADEPEFLRYFQRCLYREIQSAVFQAVVDQESSLVYSPLEDAEDTDGWVTPQQLGPWIEQGYRPRSLQVLWAPSDETGNAFARRTAVLLDRPVITPEQRLKWSSRRANAALALLSLQNNAKAWEVSRFDRDPDTRSIFLAKLPESQIALETLLEQWNKTSDAREWQCIALAIGELARASKWNDEQLNQAVAALTIRFENEPDPGVHSACEWALAQCKATEAIANLHKSFATGAPMGARKWYLTKNGEHTMICMPSVEVCVIGSPGSEIGRWEGAIGTSENLHRRRVRRPFCFSSCEVTIKQFLEFDPSFAPLWNYVESELCPVANINWNQAVKYCNWLSQKEGIPSSQWCYYPDPNDSDNMLSHDDFLLRSGYRLPMETEWELACRAGTDSPYYTGYSPSLLLKHEWVLESTRGIMSHPSGMLQPNQFGLFDMLGNTTEWCQDGNRDYEYAIRMTQYDKSDLIQGSGSMIARGGSFSSNFHECRAANRLPYDKRLNYSTVGFRVARTLVKSK